MKKRSREYHAFKMTAAIFALALLPLLSVSVCRTFQIAQGERNEEIVIGLLVGLLLDLILALVLLVLTKKRGWKRD